VYAVGWRPHETIIGERRHGEKQQKKTNESFRSDDRTSAFRNAAFHLTLNGYSQSGVVWSPPIDSMNATHSARIERVVIAGSAGPLEALLEWVPQIQPRMAVLVCHPHPLFGGTMHTKIVFRAAKAAISVGAPALRFNFRGVGQSAGTFDEGVGERDDVRAALDFLSARFPNLPVVLMGFSFGSWVGLAVGAADPRVRALVGLGLPVGSTDMSFLAGVTKPKLIVQGTEDVYGPRRRLEEFYAGLSEPKSLVWIEGADHFFTGKLREAQAAVVSFLQSLAEP
jgi:uncharacterized protein